MYWFYQRINFSPSASDSTIAESFNMHVMKKKNYAQEQSTDSTKVFPVPHHQESDELILENLNTRIVENQALKKLLDNLNSTLPKIKS
jgi:hypothetical protein